MAREENESDQHHYDELIIENINKAIDGWIEGGGHEGNFVTIIFEEAKKHYAVRHSEWRGAVLLYILSGSGVRLGKSPSISIKLLAIDCIMAWEKNVNESKSSDFEKAKLLSEIYSMKDYILRNFSMKIGWCRKVLDELITRRLRERFWISLVGYI